MITAIGGGGHGEQILKALLLADRYRIVGADADPLAPQFRLVDEAYLVPRADDPSYMESILGICERTGTQAIFHGCEPDLKVLSANRSEFAARNILFPANPERVIDIGMDKSKTMEFLRTNGFAIPRTVLLNEMRADLESIDSYPVVVKPSIGSGGSKDVFIAQSAHELELLAEYLDPDRKGSLLVQEYVGTPDQEFTVGVLHDLNGQYVNSIALRRRLSGQLNIRTSVPNRTGRPELGSTLVVSSGVSHGHIGRYPEVTGPCRKMAGLLGAKGALNVQCRVVGDTVYVFEINPRFSGTTSLRALMGYNEPDILLRRHLLDEEIAIDFPYESGWVLRYLSEARVDEAGAKPAGPP